MNTSDIEKLVKELVKKNLRVIIDTDKHVITDKTQIEVTITWDGETIDSDHVTLS